MLGSDFNTTVQELVVPPNTDGSSGSFPFGIALFSNDHLETFELFLMILEVISTANQTIDLGRTCAVGRVQSTLTNRDGRIIIARVLSGGGPGYVSPPKVHISPPKKIKLLHR